MCKVEVPYSAKQLAAPDLATSLSRGLLLVAFPDATAFIRYQGTFVIDTLEKIPPESTVAITRSIGNIFGGFYTGFVAVVSTRELNNQSSTDAFPPILPHSLASIFINELCNIIRPHRV